MRIQVLSDLHLEAGSGSPATVAHDRGLHIDDVGADLVVLAGDIAAGADGVRWAAAQWPNTPVCYVMGNHDFDDGELGTVLEECRDAADGTTVHLLERDAMRFDACNVVGTTLWTDFLLHGHVWSADTRAAAKRGMTDYRLIRWDQERRLTPSDVALLNHHSVQWVEQELASASGPAVVVTHHAPSPRSLRKGWDRDLLSGAFGSDYESLIEKYQPELWVHGHTHEARDYWIGQTHVLCNPVGYPGERTGWDPACAAHIQE